MYWFWNIEFNFACFGLLWFLLSLRLFYFFLYLSNPDPILQCHEQSKSARFLWFLTPWSGNPGIVEEIPAEASGCQSTETTSKGAFCQTHRALSKAGGPAGGLLPSCLAGLGDSLLLDSSTHMQPWASLFQAPTPPRVLGAYGLKFYYSWDVPTTPLSLSWPLGKTLSSALSPSFSTFMGEKSISFYPLVSWVGLEAPGETWWMIYKANGPSELVYLSWGEDNSAFRRAVMASHPPGMKSLLFLGSRDK